MNKTIDRLFAVGGAFIFCQVPLLMNQYSTMLSGHLAESRRQINMMQHAASLTNKTLQEYIAKFLGQQDLDFVHQGQIMQAMQTRYEDLNQAYSSLQHATVWSRPLVFIKNIDSAVLWDTVSDFTPGISLTVESLIYAVVGLGFGVLIYRGLTSLIKGLFGLIKSRPRSFPPRPL
ncbi:MAG: DUF2937 family protein [Chlamydiales bacterium]|nr:DUF2937 family protein [Chlamydiales bacterium]